MQDEYQSPQSCDSANISPMDSTATQLEEADFMVSSLSRKLTDPVVNYEANIATMCAGNSANNLTNQQKRAATERNNNSNDKHHAYLCPEIPPPPFSIGEPETVLTRATFRMALRPDKSRYVTLNFRVMRFDAEMHVGQLLNMNGIKRTQLYSASVLNCWTRNFRIKIRSTLKMSLVFKGIKARLGLHNAYGMKFCLDGFFGLEAFGDAFGNYGLGICPWMELTGDGSASSLGLEDNDNIYVGVPTEKMVELAALRMKQMGEKGDIPSHRQSTKIPSGTFVPFDADDNAEVEG